MKNIYDFPAEKLQSELIDVLAEGKNIRVERIVSDGHASPDNFWYEQEEDEWVCVAKGSARLQFEDGETDMAEGDTHFIPRGVRHRVSFTSKKCVWLAVFAKF